MAAKILLALLASSLISLPDTTGACSPGPGHQLCPRCSAPVPQVPAHQAGARAIQRIGSKPALISPDTEEVRACKRSFPTAQPQSEVLALADKVLQKFGVAKNRVLFSTSQCPDEINRDLDNAAAPKFGLPLSIGGLAGFPFAGKRGMHANFEHVPNEGALLLICSAHVGIDHEGSVGHVTRDGMAKGSTSCGAAMGAYVNVCEPNEGIINRIAEGDAEAYPTFADPHDRQENFIVKFIASKYREIKASPDPMAELPRVCARRILEDVRGILPRDLPFPVALLSGIQINFEESEDYFEMHNFQWLPAHEGTPIDFTGAQLEEFNNEKAERHAAHVLMPGAVPLSQMLADVYCGLEGQGIDMGRILFATSSCPDELNKKLDKMASAKCGRPFTMGGLCGFPFAGKTGIGAFLGHAADEGTALIICASHVGVDEHGEAGRVHRVGMREETSACGAAIQAYNFCKKNSDKIERVVQGDSAVYGGFVDPLDEEQNFVLRFVARHFHEISAASHPMVQLARVCALEICRQVEDMLPQNLPHPIVVLSGIQVNFAGPFSGEDFFAPLKFTLHRNGGQDPIALDHEFRRQD